MTGGKLNIEKVGNSLQKYRVWRKYTQKELSELSGVSVNTIKNIEKMRYYPKYQNRSSLAKALDVPMFKLFYLEESEDSNQT
jgi:DNA-binding XRE family transcriptional regulator